MPKVKEIVGLAIIIIFSSCSNASLPNLIYEKTIIVSISSLVNGGQINNDDDFSILLNTSTQATKYDSIEVDLLNQFNEILWSSSIERPPINNPIVLDSFFPILNEPGYYSLSFNITTQNDNLIQETIDFSFADGNYNIVGIKSFPVVLKPNSISLMEVTLQNPKNSDPYIIWKENNSVFASGLLSEGMDKVLWETSSKPGIYVLSVEIYPVKLPLSLESVIKPFELEETRLYVLESEEPQIEQEYYSLFNFDGDLLDRGRPSHGKENPPAVALENISPLYDIINDDIGYVISGKNTTLKVPRFILPNFEKKLKPFSLNFVIEKHLQIPGQVFRSETGDFALIIFFDQKGSINAKLISGQNEIILPSKIEPFIGKATVTFSVIPTKEELGTAWYLNGHQTAYRTIATSNQFNFTVEGETTFGDPSTNIQFILGDFSVYIGGDENNFETNSKIWENTVYLKYGKLVQFAFGFDGIIAPNEYDISVNSGVVTIGTNETLPLPLIEITESGQLELLLIEGTAQLVFEDFEKENFFNLKIPTGYSSLTWSLDGNNLNVFYLEKPLQFRPVKTDFLSIELKPNSNDGPLKIDYVLARNYLE